VREELQFNTVFTVFETRRVSEKYDSYFDNYCRFVTVVQITNIVLY